MLVLQGALEEQLEVAADSRQHLTATQQAVVGLSNLGNTCFFNSSVQLLLSCAPLQQMVLHKDHDITKGPLGYALQQASLHAAGGYRHAPSSPKTPVCSACARRSLQHMAFKLIQAQQKACIQLQGHASSRLCTLLLSTQCQADKSLLRTQITLMKAQQHQL